MSLTPDDVRSVRFKRVFRGYDESAVDAFLDEVEGELTRLQELLGTGGSDAAHLHATTLAVTPVLSAQGSHDPLEILSAAQKLADSLVTFAFSRADSILQEAAIEASRRRSQAAEEASLLLSQVLRQTETLALPDHASSYPHEKALSLSDAQAALRSAGLEAPALVAPALEVPVLKAPALEDPAPEIRDESTETDEVEVEVVQEGALAHLTQGSPSSEVAPSALVPTR